MTEKQSDIIGNQSKRTDQRWSRRDVIRRTSVTLGGGIGAVAFGSGSASAHRCPRSQGFWRTSPEAWPTFPAGARLLILDEDGSEHRVHPNTAQSRLLSELHKPIRGDKYLILVKQYIAARLNRRYAHPVPDHYADFWNRMGEYNRWIAGASRPQRSWTVNGIDGETLKEYLEAWNGGANWVCEPQTGHPRGIYGEIR